MTCEEMKVDDNKENVCVCVCVLHPSDCEQHNRVIKTELRPSLYRKACKQLCCIIDHNCSAVTHAYELLQLEHSKRGFESRLKHAVTFGFSVWSFLDGVGLEVEFKN